MRLKDEHRWILMRKPELKIERTSQPEVLQLNEAVQWIGQNRPILWVGSIVSVPDPAGFPSGYAITESLVRLILRGAIPIAQQDELTALITKEWPLEALFDEFELLGFDISESLLKFFSEMNDSVAPSPLHRAIVDYYKEGRAAHPLCITTNWDTLLEVAFRDAGFTVITAGCDQPIPDQFGKPTGDSRTIFIYHPHGSFATKDVVCSFRQQQKQVTLHPNLLYQPTLYLGYSGYEPSLYMSLEHGAGQMWCVRSELEFEIPAKRRLLSRPNTVTFVGDLCDLLQHMTVLEGKVDTRSNGVTAFDIPGKVREIITINTLCSLNSQLAVNMLTHSLLAFPSEPEATFRFAGAMKSIVNHVRNRLYDPGILAALLASTKLRDSEQTWITILAYLLRHDRNLPSSVIKELITFATQAPSSGLDTSRTQSAEDLIVYGLGQVKQRANIYRGFVRESARVDDWRIYIVTPLVSGDLAGLGETCEIWAMESIRDGDLVVASNLFDYAATCYYLRGLWNAGKMNEWAASNTDQLIQLSKGNTLIFPIQPEFAYPTHESPTV
jgi:hypothetical protein